MILHKFIVLSIASNSPNTKGVNHVDKEVKLHTCSLLGLSLIPDRLEQPCSCWCCKKSTILLGPSCYPTCTARHWCYFGTDSHHTPFGPTLHQRVAQYILLLDVCVSFPRAIFCLFRRTLTTWNRLVVVTISQLWWFIPIWFQDSWDIGCILLGCSWDIVGFGLFWASQLGWNTKTKLPHRWEFVHKVQAHWSSLLHQTGPQWPLSNLWVYWIWRFPKS